MCECKKWNIYNSSKQWVSRAEKYTDSNGQECFQLLYLHVPNTYWIQHDVVMGMKKKLVREEKCISPFYTFSKK